YEHPRPLLDALDHGFCSVETDIFLRDGQLLVGHEAKNLKPERTLEKLYLAPLRERVIKNQGHVYSVPTKFYLFVDLKTHAKDTYPVLHELLAKYHGMLTEVTHGKVTERAVTVVLSGNRPSLEELATQSPRYAAYDGRLSDLDSKAPTHLMPVISDNWASKIRWGGSAPMQTPTREFLQSCIQKAHSQGRLIRFWATPEKEAVWKLLLDLQVDLINTDRLSELRAFLLSNNR
ncbi:MAG TPA: phosphatidylinositol-specific phospholipase C/glycerophosphodiester phosphodiesterase family protein, partial [Gemmatales bacterium]|nr:phosphatidylinositol-specific phospholipase C/glycerophosphodiester phosphodiesterase family protein [Gemmatales bacterium]